MISAELSPQNELRSVSGGQGTVSHSPSVAVLMATYNGEKYLRAQLDSIAGQRFQDWTIWASDDGSIDGTGAILRDYQKALAPGRLHIVAGPQLGFSRNFIQLLCKPEVNGDFFAFADQDDLWDPDKLEAAVQWLQAVPKHIPALYCSRTRLIREDETLIGLAPIFRPQPHFANAMVQSLANGNTMVMNQAARHLIQIAGDDVDVFSHDWWAYILTTGCGGLVHYDPIARIGYRQHQENLLGMNMGFPARLKRLQLAWGGRYQNWNDRNIRALRRVHHLLTPEARRILANFESSRMKGPWGRAIGLLRSGVYRRNAFENISILIMTIFKKM